MQTEGLKGGGRHRNRLGEWKELKQEREVIKQRVKRGKERGEADWQRQVCVYVCGSVCVYSLLDILDLHAGCAAAA